LVGFADVSEQPIDLIFKAYAVQEEFMNLEDGADKLFRDVCKQLSTNTELTFKNRASYI
jgi:hypothetical protein